MKNFSNTQFEREILASERLRAKILAGLFFISTLFAGTFLCLFSNSETEELHKQSLFYIFTFLCGLTLFELLCLLYLSGLVKRNATPAIPIIKQYLNATIEISSPVIIIFLLAKEYETPVKVLHSPVVYIYFIFIILSTLRLNFRISFYIGLVAATEFFLLSLYLAQHCQGAGSGDTFLLMAISKSSTLLFCGTGAACVAHRIKLTINRSLAAAEKENKIISLFGQQVSREIAEEMLGTSGTIPSKVMRVCIMFIDIRNFTQHVAEKSPAEIVEYQNAFFSIVINAVSRHGGIVNQFLGDGCMITFGAPVALDDPCTRAVKAALEIKQQLVDQSSKGIIPFKSIGVGIHVGDAVTGNIGTKERQQYSITGSVVILAARIEQLNKEYNSQILVSENVMEFIRGGIDTNAEFIGNADLKGWHHPVGIYKVA